MLAEPLSTNSTGDLQPERAVGRPVVPLLVPAVEEDLPRGRSEELSIEELGEPPPSKSSCQAFCHGLPGSNGPVPLDRHPSATA